MAGSRPNANGPSSATGHRQPRGVPTRAGATAINAARPTTTATTFHDPPPLAAGAGVGWVVQKKKNANQLNSTEGAHDWLGVLNLFYFLLAVPSCGWAGSPLSLILSLVGAPAPWDCCCWAEGKVEVEDWEEEREEEEDEEEEVEEEVEAAVGVGGAPWLVTRNSGWSWRSSSLSPALVNP